VDPPRPRGGSTHLLRKNFVVNTLDQNQTMTTRDCFAEKQNLAPPG
jgi:hypothetical protein